MTETADRVMMRQAKIVVTAINNEGLFHGPYASGYETADDGARIAIEAAAAALSAHGLRELVGSCGGECDHLLTGERHAFELKYVAGRNVWNPYEPKCSKCGQTIGEIFLRQREALTALLGEGEKQSDVR